MTERARREEGQRGQSMLEIALLMPMLLLLALAAMDLGRGFATLQNMTNAANEGARFAAANYLTPVATLQPAVATIVANEGRLDPSWQPTVTLAVVTPVVPAYRGETNMVVTVRYPFKVLSPWVAAMSPAVPNPLTLQRTASQPVIVLPTAVPTPTP